MQITTPCTHCRAQAAIKGGMWADRGMDWPMTHIDGYPVHKACAETFGHSIESFDDATITDGVATWNANNQHPFADMLAVWAVVGLIGQDVITATEAAREAATQRFLAAYTARQAARTAAEVAEERAEMLAAFGPGETVVNVITGARTEL